MTLPHVWPLAAALKRAARALRLEAEALDASELRDVLMEQAKEVDRVAHLYETYDGVKMVIDAAHNPYLVGRPPE